MHRPLGLAGSLRALASATLLLVSACGGGGGGGESPPPPPPPPPPSSDADLASLAVSVGMLTPAFSTANAAYDVGPAGVDDVLRVTATVADAAATMKVNGLTTPSGLASAAIALPIGDGAVTVEVTAEDGVTKRSYVVATHRDDPALRASWTRGTKRVLILPVSFSDLAGPSDVPGPGGVTSGWGHVVDGTIPAAIRAFFQAQSYGAFDVVFTRLPEVALGVPYATYQATYPGSTQSKFTMWDAPGSFADDVRERARQVGLGTATPDLYDSDRYDLDIVATGFVPGQLVGASASSHGKGVFATSFKALPHELCHNLGCEHSHGRSYPALWAPTRSGTYFADAYGDLLCLMGWKDTAPDPLPADHDLNPCWKRRVGWLPAAAALDLAASGTYRVHAFDQGTIAPGRAYALRWVRDPVTTYWFDFRQAIPASENPWVGAGLEVRLGPESPITAAGVTTLLDTTPGSRGPAGGKFATMQDAALAIGRTFSDVDAGLHVTPVRKGGTSPESLDVVVNLGTFPGNSPPTVSISPATVTLAASTPQTFTATASDPDGDTLAYAWEVDDPAKPGGAEAGGTDPDARLSTQAAHAWTVGGTHRVRCTVTDLKGGVRTASAVVTITGGTTPPLTISGRVLDETGAPIEGAVVSDWKPSAPNAVPFGDAAFAGSNRTAADGRYVIPLPAIGAYTYHLTAWSEGYAFTCSVAGGAVSVTTSSVANVDFTRVRATRTVSGSVFVAGRAYDPSTDGDLWVSDGTQSVKATVGSWQMSVPDGSVRTFTATPDDPTYTVVRTFPTPYRVVDDYNLLHFSVTVPGKMPTTGFASAGATSDDTVGTVHVPVTMTPPPGSTTWPGDQAVYWWVDPSSTAEYGVDYRMTGGTLTFPGGAVPAAQSIPLEILHDGIPKVRTVVIRLGAANAITPLGPFPTFTYTIRNGS